MKLHSILFLFSLLAVFALASAMSVSNTTPHLANQTLNHAIAVVALVNESSYLIFYPDLAQAYADLGRAQSLYNASPESSIVFANKAIAEANAQYQIISSHRNQAVVAMLVLTAIFAIMLSRLMKPVRGRGRGGR